MKFICVLFVSLFLCCCETTQSSVCKDNETLCVIENEKMAAEFVIGCMEGNGFSNTSNQQEYCEKMVKLVFCKPVVGKSVTEKPVVEKPIQENPVTEKPIDGSVYFPPPVF